MAENVFGLIVPHPPIMVPGVGGNRAQVTHESLEGVGVLHSALVTFNPQTVVVMSPHAPALADAIAVDDSESFSGSLGQFGDPTTYSWRGDPELAGAVALELGRAGLDVDLRTQDRRMSAGILDHGVIVPMSFLDPEQRFQLVVISLSFLPYATHRVIGESLRAAAENLGRRIAFVASGDLSHRLTPDAPAGYSPAARTLDSEIVRLVREGALEDLARIDPEVVEDGGECGLRSFIALSGYAGKDPVPTRVLSYEGPWGVGYLTALVGSEALQAATAPAGQKGGAAGEDQSEVVRLARSAIQAYVREGARLEPAPLEEDIYPPRAGAFVSLHREGSLRGCIGTIAPTRDTLAAEVVGNAIEAATRDPRFPPVTPDELDDLDVKVDVLHEPESCRLEDLDPSRFGVITTSGWRRGLLLPDLEGVDDIKTQVQIAMNKAGIQPGEACAFERFKVDRYT